MEVKEMTMILKLAVDKMKNETENRFIIKTMEMGKFFFFNLIPVYASDSIATNYHQFLNKSSYAEI
ncbi:hypothetical protein DERF_016708 [Dermatophagoides farinae]|uniref:Uncharacterized protein n=1 Tax=Dermatophagoides farinae TaxID=6954 RepID=A0A922HEW9_DERFA|nr:hypothetical protein DERF_016708 [Dermatophagoides farinae]